MQRYTKIMGFVIIMCSGCVVSLYGMFTPPNALRRQVSSPVSVPKPVRSTNIPVMARNNAPVAIPLNQQSQQLSAKRLSDFKQNVSQASKTVLYGAPHVEEFVPYTEEEMKYEGDLTVRSRTISNKLLTKPEELEKELDYCTSLLENTKKAYDHWRAVEDEKYKKELLEYAKKYWYIPQWFEGWFKSKPSRSSAFITQDMRERLAIANLENRINSINALLDHNLPSRFDIVQWENERNMLRHELGRLRRLFQKLAWSYHSENRQKAKELRLIDMEKIINQLHVIDLKLSRARYAYAVPASEQVVKE